MIKFEQLVEAVMENVQFDALNLLEARKSADPGMNRIYQHEIGRQIRALPETGFYFSKKALKLFDKYQADFPEKTEDENFNNAVQHTWNEIQNSDKVKARLEREKSGDIRRKKDWNQGKTFGKEDLSSLDAFTKSVREAEAKYKAGDVRAGDINEQEFVDKFGDVTYSDPEPQANGYTFLNAVKDGYELQAVADTSLLGDADSVTMHDDSVEHINVWKAGKGGNPIYTYSRAAIAIDAEGGLGEETAEEAEQRKEFEAEMKSAVGDVAPRKAREAEDAAFFDKASKRAAEIKATNPEISMRDALEQAKNEILDEEEAAAAAQPAAQDDIGDDASAEAIKLRDFVNSASDEQLRTAAATARELLGDIFSGDDIESIRAGFHELAKDISNPEEAVDFTDDIDQIVGGADEDEEASAGYNSGQDIEDMSQVYY